MPNIVIRKGVTKNGGRYVATIEGVAGEAELTFSHRGAGIVSADHTGAPQTMRGTGAALALVEYLIADARAHQFKIIPLCPYVSAQYKKHSDWSDVMTAPV